ncbi:glycosyltransferase family 2 protein [Rhodohalobacter halophilus]|uniref:glycosyltransferase family 2 protein n=1 Tax=Rhodohalobacter halophilus TaxID=1812810 RepID=UPI00083FA339|nr:glycosyltransferase family 2 protein [Rhodohalobacter halophilus]
MTKTKHRPFFSIIIVTWNALHHLKRFLPQVAKTDYPNFEIIIADNASDDGSVEWVKQQFPEVRVATFDRNYGYCGGNNRASKEAKGDILIFLNNDAYPDPHWLAGLESIFQKKEVGVVQPKILSVEQPDYFEYAGAAGGFLDKMGYPFCRGRIFDYVEKDEGQYNTPSEIFWASGAALAIRKTLFERLGGFDEDFEFHMEEIDLCWQVHKSGYTVMYQPESIVYHLGGGSLPMGNPRKVYYNYRNNLLMLTKNLDGNPFFRIFGRLVLDGVAGIKAILSGNLKDTWAIIRAHFALYGSLTLTLNKRRELKAKLTATTPTHLVYQKSIVADYFLKGKKRFSELKFR